MEISPLKAPVYSAYSACFTIGKGTCQVPFHLIIELIQKFQW